jgi:glycosyltransferase involved in cell wall biosynthesis
MASSNNQTKTDTLIIISPGFPSDETDSTCLPAVQRIVRTLNQVFPKLKITIVSLQYPFRRDYYQWHKNEVHSFNGQTALLFRPLVWARVSLKLSEIVARRNVIGIVSLWCQETALIGKHFGKLKNIRHFIWLQGQDACAGNRYVRHINPSPRELIAMSEFLAEEFEKNYGIRAANIIQNGLNPDLVDNVSTKKTIDILGVGSLISLKRFDLFIKTVRAVYQEKNDLKAVLIGGGPEEQKLRTLISDTGLQSVVTMTGTLDHPLVLEYMRRSKILLHSSSYEGYSTVSVEALYYGCHVISQTYAEKREIKHWHVVNDQALTSECLQVLDGQTDHSPILANDLREEVKKLMNLFNYIEITQGTS